MKFKSLVSLAIALLFINIAFAQKAPANWFNLDASKDGVQGVSTEKTYQDLLKDRKSVTVVVAVIDSGVDTEHEDLQGKIWVNPGEIAGNGIDDDKNGYVDDIHGWNFIGGKDGTNVTNDSYEVTRLVKKLAPKYEEADPTKLTGSDLAEYNVYQKAKKVFMAKYEELKEAEQVVNIYYAYTESTKILQDHLKTTDDLTPKMIKGVESDDEKVSSAKTVMLALLDSGISKGDILGLKGYAEYFMNQIQYGYNTEFDPRSIVGDNYDDASERYYGNNDVIGHDASHGTHVAGIIAANRDNSLGMAGVAENVKIMCIRTVPDGDERDKDVANAIRYAVDNGASVVNMSFGKSFAYNKKAVDDAIKYAEEKDVLLIHAAGNSALDTDVENNFPNDKLIGTKKSPNNWIEVGALSWKADKNSVAEFSNYGKKNVDIFAPGVDIYSTTPEQHYESMSGTSMASPVVAGVAALLRSYFPDLSAKQVRKILLKTAIKDKKRMVYLPNEEGEKDLTKFGELSCTGGVVNTFTAVKKAMKTRGKKKGVKRP